MVTQTSFDHPPVPLPDQEGGKNSIWGVPPDPHSFDFAQDRLPGSAPLDSAFQLSLLRWYEEHQRDLPWRKTRDPYAILVAEVMLQQTQVERVIPKYHEFLTRFPTLAALAAAPVAEVIRAWSPLGYNSRAIRLHRLAGEVVAHWGGRLPESLDALRRLPGLGPYTSAAVACFAFQAQVPVVDTNVRRVLSRVVYGLQAPSAHELEVTAQALLSPGTAVQWNQALMDLGATLCTSQRPRCSVCPVRAWCHAAPHMTTPVKPVKKLAEQRDGYQVKVPFRGSTRYYRGRIVEYLRKLKDGDRVPATVLGRVIKGDFTQQNEAWLASLLQGLERDGLASVHYQEGWNASSGLDHVEVSLP